MATETVSARLSKFTGEQLTIPASNGTKTVFNRRAGYRSILVDPAADMRLGLVPRIDGIFIRKATGAWLDMLAQPMASGTRVIDRGSAGLSLPLLATDRLYVGFRAKVNDIYVDIGSTANAVSSTLTAENSSPTGFVSLAITVDGTDSGGATLATDGNITFTVPAGPLWSAVNLRASGLFAGEQAPNILAYWLRFAVSASLTAGTLIDQIAGFVETDGAGTNTGDTAFLSAGYVWPIHLSDDVGAIQPIAQTTTATTASVTWER